MDPRQLVAGLAYLALTGCDGSVPATRVAGVYPTTAELPANQLKLYIEFSAPMTTHAPYRHIELIDDSTGEPADAVFHQMRDGLWDPSWRRMTVLFDPGRIKRGLANHEALGLPLEAGRAYRLEISGDWLDDAGQPLATSYTKRFVAIEADRRRPSTADWSLVLPHAGTRGPLMVGFGEPLDAALLRRAFAVLGPRGEPVAVEVIAGAREASCEIRPERPWATGVHRLQVDPTLEDLAGNNLTRLFDRDLSADPDLEGATELTFEPVPTPRPSPPTPKERP